MRYIADTDGYVKQVSFGADIACGDDTCTEYTGAVPSGYASLEAWYLAEVEKLYRWKIASGNLTLDSAAVAPAAPGVTVVGHGTAGNWRWVKYVDANGEKYYDAWLSYYGPFTIGTQTGSLYKSGPNPAVGFVEAVGSTYIIYALADCNGEETWATVASHAPDDLTYTLLSSRAHTGDHWINMYVRGTWA